MKILIHADSHVDHGLSDEQLVYVIEHGLDGTVTKEVGIPIAEGGSVYNTFKLPVELGVVKCALYGPSMGDEPVHDDDAFMAKREGRHYESRMVNLHWRPTDVVTVIVGPHDGHGLVLFTAYGGAYAPKGLNDPTLSDHEREESVAFWSVHALAVG